MVLVWPEANQKLGDVRFEVLVVLALAKTKQFEMYVSSFWWC